MRAEARSLFRILFFRASGDELRGLTLRHLILGLILTWVVGAGRWWEDPKAHILQHLGLGSLAYVALLSGFLWLMLWPITSRTWPFLKIMTYVSLTSPPAFLYAIPVRAWFELATAQRVRVWFLAIVAGWRVLLWWRYLSVGVGLTRPAAAVMTGFPLTFIVVALVWLNLDRAVFDVMGGGGSDRATVNDAAYGSLFLITSIALVAFVPLLTAYVVHASRGLRSRFAGRSDKLEQPGG